MAMKIDGNRPAGDTDATRRVTTPPGAERTSAEKTAAVRADRLEVSKDAQLMTSALKAAEQTPAIRQDAVEHARKLLEAGDLGADSSKLADVVIDRLLDK